MKEYIPDYYKDFQCIADKCKDSCCIGWEIMIDSKSYKKYQNVKGEFRDRLMKGIDHEGTPAFHLDDRDRCVFLNQKNLCDIYIELGEDALCEICTQHPRFHNEYGNIRQTGLGMACEEATRLMFETKEFGLCQIQGTNTESTDDFDESVLEIQLWILDLLKKKENPVEQRIEQIFDVVQGIQDHLNQTGEILNTWKNDPVKKNHILSQMQEETYIKNWISIYQELDFMEPKIQKMFCKMEPMPCMIKEQGIDESYMEHLMSYFIYRYFMKSCEDNNLIDKVKFAILSCLIIEQMNEYCKRNHILKTPLEIARIYSKEIEYSQENMEIIFEELLFG